MELKEANVLLEEIYNLDYVINEHFKQISDSEQVHGCGHRQGDEPRLCEQREVLHEILAGELEEKDEAELEPQPEHLEPGRELPLADRFSLARLVRRAHEGLGHPDRDRFLRILKYSKAKPDVLAEARRFTCSVCERHQQVRPTRRSAPPRELAFNDCVGVDVIYLPLPGGQHKTRPALNIIDWSSKFQLMIPLTAKKPIVVREAYRQWIRIFGPPKRIALDMGREFRQAFATSAEEDGSFVDPAAVEAPNQRGITERHGKTFKFMLLKAMDNYNCQSTKEWEQLIDEVAMTKNRLLQNNGFSPMQRVLGFSTRIPGGLLSGDDGNRALPSRARMGDLSVERAMRMRKAAAQAFVEADADAALRRAIETGPRPMEDYQIGEMVYFFRKGADKARKFAPGFWCGPAKIIMVDQPSTIWVAYQSTLVKASPERIRRASAEENLTVSGWLKDLVDTKADLCTEPKQGYLDLADHPLPEIQERAESENEYEPSEPIDDTSDLTVSRRPIPPHLKRLLEYGDPPPQKRYFTKAPPPTEEQDFEDLLGGPELHPAEEGGDNEQPDSPGLPSGLPADDCDRGGGHKRDAEDDEEWPTEQPTKRSRLEYLACYYQKLEPLIAARQRKEVRLNDLSKTNQMKFRKAIEKEIKNNLSIGAYTILSQEESARVRREQPDKVMESRYVLTAKEIELNEVEDTKTAGLLLDWEGEEPCKAKARHVMKGFSETGSENIETATPQVTREGALMVAQLIASHLWKIGFMDFTQAFMSGDNIDRVLFTSQPREGVPGMQPGQLLKLEKVCYGLVDGPFCWFQHLRKLLVEKLGYVQSLADPCIYYKHREQPEGRVLSGVIAVATDDLLHGGDEYHLRCMEKIRETYRLGKFQFGHGKFTGKYFAQKEDYSIVVNQENYVKDKLINIELTKPRKRQRYAMCNEKEVSALRASVGALAWLAKETRPDLAGRVALLQQVFPKPRVMDLLEANLLTSEAKQTAASGIILMPIPVERLRIGVATDASWGNSKDREQLEDGKDDFWEETPAFWVRHHVSPRRTLFHPGANQGPELQSLLPSRKTLKDDGEALEDQWTTSESIRTWGEALWTGKTFFAKQPPGQELEHTKINDVFLKLLNTSSQGGYVVIFYDKLLETETNPQMVSVTAWKSTKLKRKTVNTLSAECQSMIMGIGNIHWHRFLLLELLGHDMKQEEWESKLAEIPFVSVVDSKSLFDCLNKLICTYAQIEDKRTAIDVAILKDDLCKTGGHVRWVEGTNMISDCLTKRMKGDFLRKICNSGFWTLHADGHQKMLQEHDVLMIAVHKPLK